MDTLTAFEKEPPEKTLLKCQRYFYTPISYGGAISENKLMGRLNGHAGNLNDFSGSINFPVTMRIRPNYCILTDSVNQVLELL